MMNIKQQKCYNEIVEIADQHGCEVVSQTYLNSMTVMEFKCPNGHNRATKSGNFKKNPMSCALCLDKRAVAGREKFELKIKELGGTVLGEYKNVGTPVDCLCPKNHACKIRPSAVNAGGGMCVKCAGQCPIDSALKFNDGIEKLGGKVMGKYINISTGVECIRKNDHQCWPLPVCIQRGDGMCRACIGLCPIEAEKKFNNSIKKLGGTVVGPYITTNKGIKCLCINGHVCYPMPNSIRRGSGMCLKCAGTCPIQSEEKFRRLVAESNGIVIGSYVNARKAIQCNCVKNHECYVYPSVLHSRGTFCAECVMIENESFGEKLVAKVLNILDIKYSREINHPALKLLRFDFKFKKGGKTYYIEYDGEQHLKYSLFFHKNIERFEKDRQRDLVKNHIINLTPKCVLIRLDYINWGQNKLCKSFNLNNLEEKLSNYLKVCFNTNDIKIFADSKIYNWLDNEINETTIIKYCK